MQAGQFSESQCCIADCASDLPGLQYARCTADARLAAVSAIAIVHLHTPIPVRVPDLLGGPRACGGVGPVRGVRLRERDYSAHVRMRAKWNARVCEHAFPSQRVSLIVWAAVSVRV